MPSTLPSSRLTSCGTDLICQFRFGSLLQAQRDRARTTLAAHTKRWVGSGFAPIDLIALERGEVPLSAELVMVAARVYDLPRVSVSAVGPQWRLLNDRTTAPEFQKVSNVSEAVLFRVAEVGRRLLIDLGSPEALCVLADAVAQDPDQLADELGSVLEGRSVTQEAVPVLDQLVVPAAGVLVARTSMGSLIARRTRVLAHVPEHQVGAVVAVSQLPAPVYPHTN